VSQGGGRTTRPPVLCHNYTQPGMLQPNTLGQVSTASPIVPVGEAPLFAPSSNPFGRIIKFY